jgi:hypothetical protein
MKFYIVNFHLKFVYILQLLSKNRLQNQAFYLIIFVFEFLGCLLQIIVWLPSLDLLSVITNN